MLILEGSISSGKIVDFHVKRNFTIKPLPHFLEPIVPSFQSSNIPIVNEVN